MRLKVLNYNNNNPDHCDRSIALRDCINYATDTGTEMITALKQVGFTDTQIYVTDDSTQVNVSLFDLSPEQLDDLIIEKQRIKRIRRGA